MEERKGVMQLDCEHVYIHQVVQLLELWRGALTDALLDDVHFYVSSLRLCKCTGCGCLKTETVVLFKARAPAIFPVLGFQGLGREVLWRGKRRSGRRWEDV